MSTPMQVKLDIMGIVSYFFKKHKVASPLILDIASGLGQNGFLLRHYSWCQNLPITIVGVDIWKPYIFKVKPTGIYDHLVIADARYLPFKENTFGVTMATEVLEHMNLTDGCLLLDQEERLSINHGLLINSTPHAEFEQGELRGNKWENHVSVWDKKLFKKLGYLVIVTPLVLKLPKLGHVFLPARNYERTAAVSGFINFIFFFIGSFANILQTLSGQMIAYKIVKRTI